MDPIGFELFKNAIFSIADEMALTVFRTTYSGVLKDNMDYSTGFADAEGRLVAQGLTLPGHLGSVPTAMASIMHHYRDDIRPGDVFIMNDPFDGGMHLPDIFVFKPLFHEGQRIAFACTVCHHTDVGGRVAGSNASDSTEIYAEGLRIAPLKMYEAGVINKTLMALGIIDEPLALVNNLTGVTIGMVYIMLPFIILPLHATLRAIDPAILNAAALCGAGRWQIFRRVLLPLSAPGAAAGALMVFVMSLGYFVTPTLLGGTANMMLAGMIAQLIQSLLNWGLGGAAAFILLSVTLAIYALQLRYFNGSAVVPGGR